MSKSFAPVAEGRQRWPAGTRLARHRHARAYAAIVLSGGYEEAGSEGRFCVGPGDVLIHGAFAAHLDRFDARAEILNLALGAPPPYARGRLRDGDLLARLAERDPRAAVAALHGEIALADDPQAEDWPDLLLADLNRDPSLSLGAWAHAQGLAAETLSRGFRQRYGVTPAAHRAEARARNALRAIAADASPLAAIAAEAGFADQAHMSRWVKTLTGASPGAWRAASNPFKTRGRLPST